jgi:hypothetical protein
MAMLAIASTDLNLRMVVAERIARLSSTVKELAARYAGLLKV